jgi:hypothetical protein
MSSTFQIVLEKLQNRGTAIILLLLERRDIHLRFIFFVNGNFFLLSIV